MAQIPSSDQTRVISQLNTSNVLGDLWASMGIDLTENEGVVRSGKRLVLNTGTADVAEITSYPAAFVSFASKKYAIAGASATGYVFSNSSPYPSATSFAKVTAANAPTNVDSLYSDMIVSNDTLYVTTPNSGLNVYFTTDGSTWGSPFTAGSSDPANTHMLASYAGRTYMSRGGSSVVSWDAANTTATSGQFTLTLSQATSVITFIRAASNRLWIGTVNTGGGKGYVYTWDGSSGSPTASYRLESQGALACVIKDDTPYIMDANGSLIAWNGGTFKTLGKLNRRRNQMLWNPTAQTNQRFIHPNGMTIRNGKINMLIDGRNFNSAVDVEETIPSGVYEYDETHGLYHKHPVAVAKAAGTIRDYGQTRIAGAGALSELNIANQTSGRNGTFLLGASYYTDATTVTSGMFYDDSNDTLQKASWFVTRKFKPEATKLGPAITAAWNKAILVYRKMLSSSDRIVIKYRSTEVEPTLATITWASSTTFTSTADLSAYAIGDEVEILNGQGAGVCAHITAYVLVAGTYSITIDETVNNTGNVTAIARFQHWVKLIEVNNQTSTWMETGINPLAATWVQFKVWFLFTGQDEIESFAIVDIPSRTSH